MNKDLINKLAEHEKRLLAIASDKARQNLWENRPSFTEFLDPGERAILKKHSHLLDANLSSYGGFKDAERQIVAFKSNYYNGEINYPIRALEIYANPHFTKLSHGDYLGALMGLGIERDRLGDILVTEQGCQLLVHETVADYILASLDKVGRLGIKIDNIPISSIEPPEIKTIRREATVASLRLDAVVSVAYKISRTKAADYIKTGRLKHNFIEETRADTDVAVGDIFSLAGYGRAELKEIGNLSKKGRQFIIIEKII